MALQHLRSSTADKRPTPAAMSDGQLALNTNLASPGLFFKDSNGDSVKIGPVHVGTTAPNATPGAGGQAGNSKGEAWLDTTAANPILKVWNGSAFVAVQPVGTGTVVSTTDSGTVTSTMILDGTILNADINASAAIVDTKLATIATAGKVSNSATTATNANTASAIVARDGSGNFTAGTITAAVTGAASSNVLKAGDTMTGALVVPLASAATPSLTFTGDLNTGIYSPGADQVAVATTGTQRLTVDTAATTSTLPVVHPLGAVGTPSITFTSDLNTGFYSPGADTLAAVTAGNNRLHITSAGNVGINTTNPSQKLEVSGSTSIIGGGFLLMQNTNRVQWGSSDTASIAGQDGGSGYLALATVGAERARIDSSGRLLVGTSTALTATDVAKSKLVLQGDTDGPGYPARFSLNNGVATMLANYKLGEIYFAGQAAGNIGASIAAYAESDWNTAGDPTDNPGYLTFSTTADGASAPTERMRITSGGEVYYGQTTTADPASANVAGTTIGTNGAYLSATRDGAPYLLLNRKTNDGGLVSFRQDGFEEGNISVSGTTVSYNGAHLSRWSQLPSNAERTEILRGSVLSNIDEMCEWPNENNEQLNRMRVSDVDGDKNVSGVFQAWDDDDDTYTDDFYCAMTGDFIIRIAEGVTVERGDLLMSAGDGTAKPQDDDIIRSKTIAKVTSTNVSCTYPDGSYCVPCVLMAC